MFALILTYSKPIQATTVTAEMVPIKAAVLTFGVGGGTVLEGK